MPRGIIHHLHRNEKRQSTCGLQLAKTEAAELLQRGTEWLAREQDLLFAQDRWSLLLLFQAMDAAGKDSTIKHVMSGVNPQGCQVFSFKQPSTEELSHDFLWRYAKRLPERGRIGIFNRSYYEEVLVVRLHADILDRQKLPDSCVSKHIWTERLGDIASLSGLISPGKIGNFQSLMFASGVSGPTTCLPMRKRSGLPPRNTRLGMSCLRTTSGSRGSW